MIQPKPVAWILRRRRDDFVRGCYANEPTPELGELFSKMTPELREQFIGTVTAGVCRHCWYDDPDGKCRCWDES